MCLAPDPPAIQPPAPAPVPEEPLKPMASPEDLNRDTPAAERAAKTGRKKLRIDLAPSGTGSGLAIPT